jgi:type IV pilus assembly protein PilB
MGLAEEKQLIQAKAQQMGYPFVDLGEARIDSSAINVVPQALCLRHNICPISKNGQSLTVAMADPNNVFALDDVKLATGMKVVPVMATLSDIQDAVKRLYEANSRGNGGGAMAPAAGGGGGGAALANTLAADIQQYSSREDLMAEEDDEAAKAAEEAPIIRVANTIILQAIEQKASDIHIEPSVRGVRVRYRVDGVLHESMMIPKYIQAPLISRYKIMADMNIAERRVPQDGRIPIRHQGKEFDMRVNSLPTHLGEKIVMRILDKSSTQIGLNRLGFWPDTQAQIESLITQPNGMLLSTGPTGAGKTTTQYSILHQINTVEKNIITIEDPVEYQLPGVSQVQVNKKAGLTFGSAMRSFMRQDPDIIMVGEIRDLETAEMAIEASLTGHLVLSTLHTNDAPSAVTRLVDMGIEPFLISATIIGVLAQRLGRRNCEKCKAPYQVPASELRRFGYMPEDPDEMVTLYKGVGCDECRHSGLKGRVGLYEMMTINDEIQELIVRRAPLADVREAARANGMKLLKEDGLRKILQGITTPEEVMRVVYTAGQSG